MVSPKALATHHMMVVLTFESEPPHDTNPQAESSEPTAHSAAI